MGATLMRAAVVTANFGSHDDQHPIAEQTVDADWHYFVDRDAGWDWRGGPWTIRPETPWAEDEASHDPRMYAKRYRMTPWRFVGLDGRYDFIVWIDASTEVTSRHFLADAIAAADNGCALTTWKHPKRDDVGVEAVVSLAENEAKYGPYLDAIRRQVAEYTAAGLPEPSGLYATGTLVWNMGVGGGEGSPRQAHVLGSEWLAETERTSVHDQLSLPAVAWRLGMKVGTFPFSQIEYAPKVMGNRWLRYHEHTRST